jgi:hypothetical protein
MGPRDVLSAINASIAKGGPYTPELPVRRDIRPRKGRQLRLPLDTGKMVKHVRR